MVFERLVTIAVISREPRLVVFFFFFIVQVNGYPLVHNAFAFMRVARRYGV